MKKTLIAAAAIAASSFSMLAFAQSAGIASDAAGSVTIDLSGTLEQRCEISTTADGFDALDLEVTTAQGTGSLSVSCNFSGSPTVTVSSLNAGKLKNNDPEVEASLAYLFVVGTDELNLATSKTPAFPIVNDGTTLTPTEKDISVKLSETAVIAGTYVDTITATVSPN